MNCKTTKILLIALFALLFGQSASAQSFSKALGLLSDSIYIIAEDEEMLNRLRNMPNIDVGRGVSFSPKEKWFQMTMRFRMQNMVGFTFNDQFSLDQTEAQVKRLRLRFDGFVISPKLTYLIQLGFTPYDAALLPNENINVVRDAMVYYAPNSNWNFGFGQTKIRGNRARVNSSSALQFVDRSIVNSEFNLDRDFGFFGEFNKKLFADFNLVAKGSVTAGDGRNQQSAAKSGYAYTGRLEFFPLGRFKLLGDVFEGDYEREESPKFMIAGVASYNDRAVRLRGQTGGYIADEQTRTLNAYFVDVIFKYRGFAFYTDWMSRRSNDDLLIYDSEGAVVQNIFGGHGLNLQTSYIFPSNWEFALRNSTLFPDKKIQSRVKYEHWNQSTFGVTRYLIGHNLKIQADASFNYRKGQPKATYNPYELRFQVELGF